MLHIKLSLSTLMPHAVCLVLAINLACTIQAQSSAESDCGDGIDNDQDGLTDCEDEDCAFGCGADFYLPNAFTPNGDNMNDVFHPMSVTQVSTYEFRIFNIQGKELFFSENQEQGWTGSVNGGEYFAQTGMYFYALTYSITPGDVRLLSGNVMLIR